VASREWKRYPQSIYLPGRDYPLGYSVSIFNNLFLKVGLPLAVLGYIWGWFPRYGALLTILITLTLALFGLIAYTAYLGVLQFRLGDLNLRDVKPKEIYNYGAISFLGIAGSALIVQLDVIMVGGFIGNEAAGIYTFAAFAAMVISIPYKAVNSITSPLVATALSNNDIATIEHLYQNASKVLFAIGGVVFTGMVVCLPYVYEFTEYTGRYAIAYSATLLLGASQLFDQVTSINATIFGQSRYYKWYIALLILMGLVNVILNYYFIGTLEMGYTGAAIATAISLGLLNVFKALFVTVKLKVQPFTWSIVYTTIALLFIGFVSYVLPDFFPSPFLNFGIKGGVIVGLFFLYVRYTNGIPVMKKILQGGLKELFA
jgi:O-antigen/teichoic acid export membrane protein